MGWNKNGYGGVWKPIRDKCSFGVCRRLFPKEKAILSIDPFGYHSNETGWSADIRCSHCGRQVYYVGNRCERKSDVEKKVRALWRFANDMDNSDEQ